MDDLRLIAGGRKIFGSDTTNRIAGFVYLSVDGTSYMVAADVAYQVSRIEREEIFGMSGECDYSEKPIAGYISAVLRDMGGVVIADITTMTNVTVVVELANGKTISGAKMWVASSGPVKTADGTFEVTWKGRKVDELSQSLP